MKTPEDYINNLNKPTAISQKATFILISVIFAIGFLMGMMFSKIFWR